jgi:hypothetical protein
MTLQEFSQKNKPLTSRYHPKVKSVRTDIGLLRIQKTTAKIGMLSSLGTLVISGFVKFNGAKQLHIGSGIALVGFSIWHHFLNQPKNKPKLTHKKNKANL